MAYSEEQGTNNLYIACKHIWEVIQALTNVLTFLKQMLLVATKFKTWSVSIIWKSYLLKISSYTIMIDARQQLVTYLVDFVQETSRQSRVAVERCVCN